MKLRLGNSEHGLPWKMNTEHTYYYLSHYNQTFNIFNESRSLIKPKS